MENNDNLISMCGYLLYVSTLFSKDSYKIKNYFKLIDDVDLECLYLLISDELDRRSKK